MVNVKIFLILDTLSMFCLIALNVYAPTYWGVFAFGVVAHSWAGNAFRLFDG